MIEQVKYDNVFVLSVRDDSIWITQTDNNVPQIVTIERENLAQLISILSSELLKQQSIKKE